MKKSAVILLLATLMASLFSVNILAISSEGDSSEIPYTTHNYILADNDIAAASKAVYKTETVLTASKLGISDFAELKDISADKAGNIFLLDSKNSRIVMLNSRLKVVKEITSLKCESGEVSFAGACGIFAYNTDALYIADTENARVLEADYDGNIRKEILLPDSKLIPEDFTYRPIKLTVDSSGYLYVLSDGSYYGAILYSPDYDFLGFYGANTVSNGVLHTITRLWKSLTMNATKSAASSSKVPYQFTDLYADQNDFIYTSTGKIPEGSQQGQIKRLRPGGKNVLNSESTVFGEEEIATVNGNLLTQNIAGVAVDDDGFIYCYDVAYGRVYIYDSECYMLAAFGGGAGSGEQDGSFSQISAIDISDNGDRIIVSDSLKESVTVFSVTEYGKKLKSARKMTLNGDYEESVPLWKEILKSDKNCQLANVGLAKAAIAEKDYSATLNYAKAGYEKKIYSQAFSYVRKAEVKENFNIIIAAVIGFAAIVIAAVAVIKKRKIILMKNAQVKMMLSAPLHPAEVFGEVKRTASGSVAIGVVIMTLFYISAILKSISSGFLFKQTGVNATNSLLVLLQTIGFIVLWTITNWGMATLMGGIGKLREIFIVITYSMLPLIVSNLIYTVFSHCLNESEGAFLSVLSVVALLYSVFMIIIGSIIIHDVSFGKFVAVTLATLVGMLILIFLGILVFILVQQTAAFIGTLSRELFFR